MIIKTILVQFEHIKSNRLTFSLICLTLIIILMIAYKHQTLPQGIAYVLVMYVCALITDLYALMRPYSNELVVRKAGRESFYFIGCFVLGFVFLYIRFASGLQWDSLNQVVKLALVPLLIFVYPIALAIIFFLMKYKPADLGLRFQGVMLVLPIVFLCAITSYVVSPQAFTWHKLLEAEGSVIGVLFSGFIVAGLSEELFRVVGQTRLGVLFHNKGLGWFVTTVLWACMHAPKWYGESHDWSETFYSVIRIVPIGLMWGYVTHRTKSFLPSVLIHGMNVWGIQNF